MYIPPEALDEILKLGNQAVPQEACGVLVVDYPRHYVRSLVNTSNDPERSYAVDNRELVETLVDLMESEDIVIQREDVVIWHTHPSGYVGPSRGDISAKEPTLNYLVVALPNGEATQF